MAVQSGIAEVVSVIDDWMDKTRRRKSGPSAGHWGE